MRRILKLLAIGGLGAYVAVLVLLYVKQGDLLYPRNPARIDTAAVDLPGVEETELTASDGERLIAWVVPPRQDKPVLLYFHGNGGNLGRGRRTTQLRSLTEDGTGLFAVSYRGYGGWTGMPSEEGLLLDARAAYAAAVARFGADRLVGYGESLGTGVVLKLAVEQPLKAIILDAPYLSTASVAQLAYPYVPVALLMKDKFHSDAVIGKVRAPLLVLHGERDGVVPFAQGRELYEMANQPKRFIRLPDGGHANLSTPGSVPEIRRFITDVAAGSFSGEEARTVP